MNKFFWRIGVFPVMLCSVVMLGCSAHSRTSAGPETHNQTAGATPAGYETPDQKAVASSVAIGRNNEQKGIMSSADYLRWEQVGNKVSAQRHMDDSDVDWALSVMQKPSTRPAQVRVMMMGLFLSPHTFGPTQQQKIRAAVTPLLTSSDLVEKDYAKAVIYGRPKRTQHIPVKG